MRVNVKSKSIKSPGVEPGGMVGQFRVLLREICSARAEQKSAEAVVAKRANESWQERRAEEDAGKALGSIVPGGKKKCSDVSSL